jgi:hypothetical protein
MVYYGQWLGGYSGEGHGPRLRGERDDETRGQYFQI